MPSNCYILGIFRECLCNITTQTMVVGYSWTGEWAFPQAHSTFTIRLRAGPSGSASIAPDIRPSYRLAPSPMGLRHLVFVRLAPCCVPLGVLLRFTGASLAGFVERLRSVTFAPRHRAFVFISGSRPSVVAPSLITRRWLPQQG